MERVLPERIERRVAAERRTNLTPVDRRLDVRQSKTACEVAVGVRRRDEGIGRVHLALEVARRGRLHAVRAVRPAGQVLEGRAEDGPRVRDVLVGKIDRQDRLGQMRDPGHLVLAPVGIGRIAGEERALPEAEDRRVEGHHVRLRCEHDDGRVAARRKRAALSQEAEVRSDVLALPAGEPDHLDQVSVVDPRGIEPLREQLELEGAALRVPRAQDRRHPLRSVMARIGARVLQQPRRVQQDLPRIGAPVDGPVDQVVVWLAVRRGGRSEDLGDRLVPLDRDVRVSLLEDVAAGREERELEGPELRRRREEVIEGRVEPVDDADPVPVPVPGIDHDRGHRVLAHAAVGARARFPGS